MGGGGGGWFPKKKGVGWFRMPPPPFSRQRQAVALFGGRVLLGQWVLCNGKGPEPGGEGPSIPEPKALRPKTGVLQGDLLGTKTDAWESLGQSYWSESHAHAFFIMIMLHEGFNSFRCALWITGPWIAGAFALQ